MWLHYLRAGKVDEMIYMRKGEYWNKIWKGLMGTDLITKALQVKSGRNKSIEIDYRKRSR